MIQVQVVVVVVGRDSSPLSDSLSFISGQTIRKSKLDLAFLSLGRALVDINLGSEAEPKHATFYSHTLSAQECLETQIDQQVPLYLRIIEFDHCFARLKLKLELKPKQKLKLKLKCSLSRTIQRKVKSELQLSSAHLIQRISPKH